MRSCSPWSSAWLSGPERPHGLPVACSGPSTQQAACSSRHPPHAAAAMHRRATAARTATADAAEIVSDSMRCDVAAARPVNMGKAYVKALRVTVDLGELEQLTREYRSHLDVQAVTAMASRLADAASGQWRPIRSESSASLASEGAVSGTAFSPSDVHGVLVRSWLPLFARFVSCMDAAGLCICVQSAAKVHKQLHERSQQPATSSSSSSSSSSDPSSSYEPSGSPHQAAGGRVPLLSEVLLDAVLDSSDAQLHSFSTRAAVQLLWGLATLSCPPNSAWLSRFLLCALPAASLPRASAHDLSLLMWSLATLGHAPPGRWQAHLLDACLPQLRVFSPYQLGLLMWSLAALRIRPADAFMDAALQRTEALLLRDQQPLETLVSDQEPSSSFSASPAAAAGSAGGTDDDWQPLQQWVPKQEQDAPSTPSSPCRQQPGQPEARSRQTEQAGRLETHNGRTEGRSSLPQEPSSDGSSRQGQQQQQRHFGSSREWDPGPAAYLAGIPRPHSLHHPPDPGPREALLSHPLTSSSLTSASSISNTSSRAASTFPTGSLAQLSYALCILSYRPSHSFCSAVMAALVAEAAASDSPTSPSSSSSSQAASSPASSSLGSRRPAGGPSRPSLLRRMSAQELMLVLMGLAHWRCRPDAAWQEALCRSTGPALAHAPAASVAGTLWALGQMGARPSTAWMHAAEARLAETWRQLPPAAAARCAAALAALGYSPAPALGAGLVALLCHHLPRVPAKHLFPAVLACARVRLPASPAQVRALVLGPALHSKYEFCHFHNLVQHAAAVAAWGVLPGPRWCSLLLGALEDKLPSASAGALAEVLPALVPLLLPRVEPHLGPALPPPPPPPRASSNASSSTASSSSSAEALRQQQRQPSSPGNAWWHGRCSVLLRHCLERSAAMSPSQQAQLLAAAAQLGLSIPPGFDLGRGSRSSPPSEQAGSSPPLSGEELSPRAFGAAPSPAPSLRGVYAWPSKHLDDSDQVEQTDDELQDLAFGHQTGPSDAELVEQQAMPLVDRRRIAAAVRLQVL